MVLQAGSDTCTEDTGRDFAEESEQPGAQTNREVRFQHLRTYTMRTLLASSTVLFTILVSFAFGIACGYVVILGILRTFARSPRPASEAKSAPPQTTAAVASASHSTF
jgi:hypothetical protein